MSPEASHSTKDGLSLEGTQRSGKDSSLNDLPLLSLGKKLMLTANLWGTEASCDFQHIYTVPLLLMLGMPLSFVLFGGIIAGPASMLLLPVIGWLTDRGSNPTRRKTAAIIFASCLLFIGLSSVVVANLMHIQYLLEYQASTSPDVILSWSDPNGTIDVREGGDTGLLTASNGPGVFTSTPATDASYSVTFAPAKNDGTIPSKAFLGMFGFVVLDVGFDAMNSMVRSFVLTCAPPAQHSSVLIVGLVMASAGGVSTAALGVVDFTSLLGLPPIQGSDLAVQTTVQAVIVMLSALLSLLSTLLTGRNQLKHLPPNGQPNDQHKQLNGEATGVRDAWTQCEDDSQLTRSCRTDVLENSCRSFGTGAAHFDPTLALLEEAHLPSFAEEGDGEEERRPLLQEEEAGDGEEEHVKSHSYRRSSVSASAFVSVSASHGASHSNLVSSSSQQLQPRRALHEDVIDTETKERNGRVPAGSQKGFKTNIGFLCLSVAFCNATVLCFTMNASDFVAKVIYGGDPNASPDSESTARYQEGLRSASVGFLIYFGSYLVVSFIHPRLLAFLGRRVEFVAVHLAVAVCLVVTALSERLEAFYFLALVAGLHRACFFCVPFITAVDILQAKVDAEGEGTVRTGLLMSVVTSAIPLSYCTLFPWIGALEEYTGVVAVPLWLGSGYSCLAALAFLFIAKV